MISFSNQNFFQFIILSGAGIAVIIIFLSLFVADLKQKKNIYLILFIGSLGMNNLSNYMIDINLHKLFPIIPLLPIPLTLMIPISCYFYLRTTIDNPFKISAQEKTMFFLIFVELVFYLVLMTTYGIQKDIITNNTSYITKLFQLKEFISIFLTIFLCVDIVFKFYVKTKKQISSNTKNKYKWGKIFFALSASIVLAWTISYVYGFFNGNFSRKVYYPIWCVSTFVICYAGVYGVH